MKFPSIAFFNMMMKLKKQLLFCIISISIFVLATAAAWIYSKIDGALPLLEGKKTIFGLSETTIIERDALGVPTISAKNRADAAVALGFIHAQERFFQMDLLRRNAAGELSSLFGEDALAYDKSIRLHRFRDRARTIVKHLPTEQKKFLKAYTRGINQGLDHLKSAPFEYLLLQQVPVQWQEEDSILSVFSMYLDLQGQQMKRELSMGVMQQAFSPALFDFLNPKGSRWDAAIDNTQYSASPPPETPWPSASSSHVLPNRTTTARLPQQERFIGSNNWAVSGTISQTHSAIIANDMHLGIRVPNTWFKARLKYLNQGNAVDITGLTLPGTPNIIVGSNKNIAWGFTNSYGDWSDVIVLKTNEDKSAYLTTGGYQPFTFHKHVIAIKDKNSVEFETKETQWGPVVGENAAGELLAYRWVAHDMNAVNLAITDLETATTIDHALYIAAHAGIPAQNMVIGDKAGNIAWTIMGPIPKKRGNVGQSPQDWSTGANGWDGYLPALEYPHIINPTSNRLWTANSRVVGNEMLDTIGNSGYAIGARASQIRDRLFEQSRFDEQALLNIALDTEARFMQRWQHFLRDRILTKEALLAQPQWQEVKKIIDVPVLKADVDSVAYRIVRNFRIQVRNLVFTPFNQHLSALDDNFNIYAIENQLETPLWHMITEQPDTYMWLAHSSWQALFEEALGNALTEITKDQDLADATWGIENQATINHPLASAIPFFGKFLNMPTEPLPGDNYMPRVDGGSFGASERMIVSPGHEERGIMHLPTSQAGHPWSPYFGLGHDDWVKGKSTPFLPGKTQYTLTLLSY